MLEVFADPLNVRPQTSKRLISDRNAVSQGFDGFFSHSAISTQGSRGCRCSHIPLFRSYRSTGRTKLAAQPAASSLLSNKA